MSQKEIEVKVRQARGALSGRVGFVSGAVAVVRGARRVGWDS